jgi:hypothetical protein
LVRSKLSQIVRWVWVLIGALLVVLLTLWGPDALLPIIALMLISFPASLLATPITAFVFDFPVRFEGLPFPPASWIYGVLALVLGYLQWFVLLPGLVTRISAWHRKTRLADNACGAPKPP